jgi:uncharacterized membrane protein YedE/YeeE
VNPKTFFGELKRRNVYKVAIAYAVVGWLLTQVATQVFPFFEIPNWGIRLVVLTIAIGFPIPLIIAWASDRTDSLTASFAFIGLAFVAAGSLILGLRIRDPLNASQS